MNLATSLERSHFLLLLCSAVAILGLTITTGSASAAPPKCHGKKATAWTRSDAPKTLEGTAGPDVFVTGKGDDTITGNEGRDVVCSHGGDDTIDGGPGIDRIYSGSGDDYLVGKWGDDVLCAYGGKDAVFGGQGDDWISMGPGPYYYDADGSGPDGEYGMYQMWFDGEMGYGVGIGSGGDDVMTEGMTHVKGAKLDERWYC